MVGRTVSVVCVGWGYIFCFRWSNLEELLRVGKINVIKHE